MTNLSSEICFKLRDARRAAGLSQTDLSREVGCKQSALSMFEQGQPTKLNDEVVEKLAQKFKIELKETKAPSCDLPSHSNLALPLAHRGFCPNPACSTNHAFTVDGRQLYLPHRDEADPVGGKFCAFCGEVLEKRCPNCGAPVHAGAICSLCGNPYVVI